MGLRKWKWPLAWLAQIVLMAVLSAAVALLAPVSAVLHGIASWVLMPLAGAVSAYRTTRRGLLNYAAWIAPPACMGAVHWAIWTYLPSPGPVLLCALISLIGAAAGEVMNNRIVKK